MRICEQQRRQRNEDFRPRMLGSFGLPLVQFNLSRLTQVVKKVPN
jgi:hypothetical protein